VAGKTISFVSILTIFIMHPSLIKSTYQSFVGDLERTRARHLIIDGDTLILVGNQVAVQIVVQVALGDLVAQDKGARESLSDRCRH